MLMKNAFLFHCLLFPGLLLAQDFTLFESGTNAHIAFANITLYKNDTVVGGVYSNRNGEVFLPKTIEFDKLYITHLQYLTLTLDAEDLKLRIGLQSKTTYLEPTVVLPSNLRASHFLGIPYSRKSTTVSPYESKGFEVLLFVDNPNSEPQKLKSFVFYSKRTASKIKSFFRLVLYENINGRVGEKIAFEHVFTLSNERNKQWIISLENENLLLPEDGFFIGLEWLGYEEIGVQQKHIENSFEICRSVFFVIVKRDPSNPPTFYRSIFEENIWKPLDDVVFWEDKNFELLPMFGIEVFD